MTLKQAARMGGIVTFVLLTTLVFFLGGNQRQAFAHRDPDLSRPPRPSEIICFVFDQLNHVGKPLPVFNADDCQNTPPAPPQCIDGIDNDGDGLIDAADPGCRDAGDNNEFNSSAVLPSQCADGIDNDGDGLTDFVPIFGDPDCEGIFDNDEGGGPPPPPPPPPPSPGFENTLALCSDGVDNDGDGRVDLNDFDCSSFLPKLVVVKIVINDNAGTSTVSSFSLHVATTSTGMVETIGVSSGATTTVSAGTWTVGEIQKSGYTAIFGGDCNSSGQVTLAAGQTKTCTIINNDVAPGAPACADGIDNDGDGRIDSSDPGCSGPSDNNESDATGGSGPGPTDGGGPPQPTGGGGNGPIVGSYGVVDGTASGIVLGAATTTESCDTYLTAFIKAGNKNDPEQVRRLQAVLRDFEGADIEVNGVYDAATLAAVHAFQTKYASDILTPWGIEKSTGFVYLTTRKKVNEIYCKNTRQFPLTEAQLQEIARVRALVGSQASAPSQTQIQGAATSSATTGTSNVFVPPKIDVLQQVGAVGETTQTSGGSGACSSVPCSFLDFVRGIFAPR